MVHHKWLSRKNNKAYQKAKDTIKLHGWRNIYHRNINQKKVGAAVFISDRADFKVRKVIRDKERHYIIINGSVLQEDVTILNMYVPNNRASN